MTEEDRKVLGQGLSGTHYERQNVAPGRQKRHEAISRLEGLGQAYSIL